MTIEEAIKTGILFEHKVRARYLEAAAAAQDQTAQKVFHTLAQEELGHVAYLESRLVEWQSTGILARDKLETVLPAAERIVAAMARLPAQVPDAQADHGSELEWLRRALAAEEETSAFYRQMASELPADGQELFSRFLELEAGHAAIVQAEIDSVSRLGFWFDLAEFDLEAG